MSYKFTLPIYNVIKTTKSNKNQAITLNWRAIAHRFTYSKAKKSFSSIMKEQIESFDPINHTVKIKYTYYAKRNGTDLDNFVGMTKKFFQDSLVDHGFLPDDNVKYIVANSECYGGIDKDNPRVEAEIVAYSISSN